MKGYRGFRRAKKQMFYDLKEWNEDQLLGRLEGTETWHCLSRADLILSKPSQLRDQGFKPIFESDVVKDLTGRLFCVGFNQTTMTWELVDLDDLKLKRPMSASEPLGVVGHMFQGLMDIKSQADLVQVEDTPAPRTQQTGWSTPLVTPEVSGFKAPTVSATSVYSLDLPNFMKHRQSN